MKVFISGLFNRGKENEYVELEAAAKCSLEGLMKNGCSDMASKNDEKWLANFEALKAYIIEHKHLPDKHKDTDRNKLSWWKYQMKKKKAGTLTEEQIRLLDEIAGMRSTEHTGGRRKAFTIND